MTVFLIQMYCSAVRGWKLPRWKETCTNHYFQRLPTQNINVKTMCKTRPDTKGRQSMFFDLCSFKKYLLDSCSLFSLLQFGLSDFIDNFYYIILYLRENWTHSHILDNSLLKRKTIYLRSNVNKTLCLNLRRSDST